MLAKLEFELPEERYDFEMAQQGVRLAGAIDEAMNLLRKYKKYRDLTPDQILIMDEFSDEFYAIFSDLKLDEY